MAFLAGPFDPEGMSRRGARLFGKRYRWVTTLAGRVRQAFPSTAPPRRSVLARFIASDDGLHRALERYEDLHVAHWIIPAEMTSRGEPPWSVPTLRTLPELADALDFTPGEIQWFADRFGGRERGVTPRSSHYRYRILTKPSGRVRLIESPKYRLKELQRRILKRVLAGVPVHPAAHGFVPGRSIKTFASEHVGRRAVLRMDLEDFFPSISAGRVQALFRTLGYPERVADCLTAICTHRTPDDVWANIAADLSGPEFWRCRWMHSERHLPQGAPTSPTIANLGSYRMDLRLSALARDASASYTRYADDLAFSGDETFARGVHRFRLSAAVIAMEEGFRVNFRKTRIERASVRQKLAGIIVNERLNVPRADYDALKATLTNCVRLGPSSQNREQHSDFQGHLLGRIAFVAMIHAERGRKLRAIFDRIDWTANA